MKHLFKHKSATITHDEAKALIKRFFDGDTSIKEEQMLYAYFATGKAQSDLQQYAPMFGWYANNLNEAHTAQPSRHWMRWAAAAVTIGIIGTVAIKLIDRQPKVDSALAEMYAGSYIIRNGEKITDINEILPEILETEKMAEDVIAKSQEVANYDIDDEDIIYESLSCITDAKLRRQIADELNS